MAIEPEYANAMRYLADAMDLMPNLHTIQIICAGHWFGRCKSRKIIDTDQFQKAFAGHVYPSVRRAVLPHQARGMFACLPAVTDVYLNQFYVKNFAEFSGDPVMQSKNLGGWSIVREPLLQVRGCYS